jgi:hypothetical protein
MHVRSYLLSNVRLLTTPSSCLQVLSINDLDKKEALHALTRMRRDVDYQMGTPASIMEAVSVVGGRLQYLNKVSKAPHMAAMAREMLVVEKAWLLGQIGLIPDCDDDVMDEVCLLMVFTLLLDCAFVALCCTD